MGNLIGGVADRRNRQLLVVEGSVFAAVDDFPLPYPARFDGFPHLAIKLRAVHTRFEQAGILADNLLQAVSRQGGESGIDPMDGALRVGDDDADGGRLQRRRLQVNLLLHALSSRNIPGNTLDPDRLPVFVKHAGANFHGQPRSGFGDDLEFNVCERFLLGCFAQRLIQKMPVFRRHNPPNVHVESFFAGVAQYLFGRVVP